MEEPPFFVDNDLLNRMVGMELLQASLEVGELVAQHQSHTCTDALLMAAGDIQGDSADAITNQLVEQVYALKTRIAEGKIETVGNIFIHILVINDIETVIGKVFLHDAGFLAILLNILDEVEGAIVSALKHGSHGILDRVGGTGAEAIEGAENQGTTQLSLAIETT